MQHEIECEPSESEKQVSTLHTAKPADINSDTTDTHIHWVTTHTHLLGDNKVDFGGNCSSNAEVSYYIIDTDPAKWQKKLMVLLAQSY